jgi:hypothetical protein
MNFITVTKVANKEENERVSERESRNKKSLHAHSIRNGKNRINFRTFFLSLKIYSHKNQNDILKRNCLFFSESLLIVRYKHRIETYKELIYCILISCDCYTCIVKTLLHAFTLLSYGCCTC